MRLCPPARHRLRVTRGAPVSCRSSRGRPRTPSRQRAPLPATEPSSDTDPAPADAAPEPPSPPRRGRWRRGGSRRGGSWQRCDLRASRGKHRRGLRRTGLDDFQFPPPWKKVSRKKKPPNKNPAGPPKNKVFISLPLSNRLSAQDNSKGFLGATCCKLYGSCKLFGTP